MTQKRIIFRFLPLFLEFSIIVEKTRPDLELILARFDELAAFLKKPIE